MRKKRMMNLSDGTREMIEGYELLCRFAAMTDAHRSRSAINRLFND